MFTNAYKCLPMFTNEHIALAHGKDGQHRDKMSQRANAMRVFTNIFKCLHISTNVFKWLQIILAYGNDGQQIGKMSQRANAMRMFTQNTMRVFTEPAICNFSCQCQNIYIFTNIYKKS